MLWLFGFVRGPEALAAIRAAALREDRRAYTVAAEVYESSPPAEKTLHARAC